MTEDRPDTESAGRQASAGKPPRRKHPLSIWISGGAFLALPVLQVAGILRAQAQGRTEDAIPDVRLAVGVCVGLIGLAVIFGNRPCLTLARPFSVVGILLVGVSIFAAMAFAARAPYRAFGPNANHLVALLVTMGWLFAWSGEAKYFCSTKESATAKQTPERDK